MSDERTEPHKCSTPTEPTPPVSYISVYWDCEDRCWRLASADLATSIEEACDQANDWGEPDHVLVYKLSPETVVLR
jgi:hypothetical protein